MKCRDCGRTVMRKSKFCPQCGAAVQPKRTAPQQQRLKSSTVIMYIVGLVAVGIVIGLAISERSRDGGDTPGLHEASNAALMGGPVLEIAGELMCPCGTCNHVLNECLCDHTNGGRATRTFIAQQIQLGHKKPHILEMVHEQFAAQFKSVHASKMEVWE